VSLLREPDILRRSDGESESRTFEGATTIKALDRGKVQMSSPQSHDQIEATLAGADLVIADISDGFGSGLNEDDLTTYLDRVTQLNHKAWVTISPYGLSGPDAVRPGSDFTTLAAGGLLAYTPHLRAGRRPIRPAGFQALLTAGEVAAVGGLYAYSHARQISGPVHVEVSSQEAVLASGPFFECAHTLFNCKGASGSSRYASPTGMFSCLDGDVYISTLEDHHWRGIVTSMDSPEWALGIETVADRLDHAEEIDSYLSAWTGAHTKDDASAILQRNGVPATPVNSPIDVLNSAQSKARGFVQDADRNGMDPILRAPVITNDRSHDEYDVSEDRFEPKGPGIAGLKILDLSQVLGPPLATSWLGAMGADVVKVEDPKRLELYRRLGPFADGVPGIERSAYFNVTNHSKRGVALDLNQVKGDEIESLVKWAEMVVENWSSSRAERAGLERIVDMNPHALAVSVTGFGRTGPMAEYRAYGHNLHAYSGLIYSTRDEDGQMADVGTPYADPLLSVFLVALISAAAISGWEDEEHLDVAMADVLAGHFREFMSFGQEEIAQTYFALDGVFRCQGDDTWVAVTVRDERDWDALRTCLGNPPALRDIDFASIRHDATVRSVIDDLCGEQSREHWAKLFRDAGLPASAVWNSAGLIADAHLRDRVTFQPTMNAELGERSLVAVPWRLAGQGPLHLTAAPALGSTSIAEVLGGRA
jgi:crotonobetainyl-CoA:carnitine CoA-transferase CaiB-like acyl-CoA transferase